MGRPKLNKRTVEQQEYDLAFETDLFLKGCGYREIAIRLNQDIKNRGLEYSISHVAVFNDMKKAMIQWKKERFDNIDAYINQELKKLDRMEFEVWNAWIKSCNGRERTKSRNSKKARKVDADVETLDHYGYDESMTETSAGNPRFMDVLLNIQQRRAKLLGYDAPIKVDVGGPARDSDKPKYDAKDIPNEVLFAAVDAIQDSLYNREIDNKGKPDE